MNEMNTPLSPGAPVAPITGNNTPPPVHLHRLLLGLAVVVMAFDTCFWKVNGPGFSIGIFALVLGGVILWNRDLEKATKINQALGVLLIGAAFASMIETGVTNTLVLLTLFVVLAGQTYFHAVGTFAGRCLSQLVALLLAPGRPFWLGGRLTRAVFDSGMGKMGGVLGGFLLTLPAIVLALGFGSLLAQGNAVFGTWSSSFFDWFWKQFCLYFDVERISLWLVAAFLSLPLLRPSDLAGKWWKPGEWLGRLPEIIPTRGAIFSSVLTLLVLNVLFLVANTADALFLWIGQALPKGVTYSGFVHQGTNALTWTVVLSAVVLAGIFQQSLRVAGRRELKALALLWIAQNLFLLLSVGLRLKLYIEAYDMTVTRLSVIIFLVLVAAGYVLLTIKIMRDKSLSWLAGGCAVAVFATFFITQFLDLGGWSANYNVARWEKDRSRNLDMAYLYSQGADAWPALHRVHEVVPAIAILNDEENRGCLTDSSPDLAKFDMTHWREFSLRAYWNRWAIDDKK